MTFLHQALVNGVQWKLAGSVAGNKTGQFLDGNDRGLAVIVIANKAKVPASNRPICVLPERLRESA